MGGGRGASRREVVAGAAALACSGMSQALADPDAMRAAMRAALGDGPVTRGRVHVDLPPVAESGHSVPLAIAINSPMTAADHVAEVFVFSPENPLPVVSRFRLSPRSGRPEIRTSIRLATTQEVHVVAVMSDGSRWLGTAEVDVTSAACFDPT